MPFFNDSDELGTVMKELWVTIADDSKISSPLLDSKLIVRFHYKEPDGQITIDCSDGENMVIEWGDCVKQPVVEMFMQADVAHKFWMGQVNVPMYLLNGKVKVGIGVGRGKKLHDKRATVAQRQAKRDMDRAVKDSKR